MQDPVLIEQIRKEYRRVELLLPVYESIVPSGQLARDILMVVLREGEASIASGDVERMKRALSSLREIRDKGLK